MRNHRRRFDWHHIGQIYSEDFTKFCVLLRIYELKVSSRAVGAVCVGGAWTRPLPVFDRLAKPISTGEADYAHHNTCLSGFTDLPMALISIDNGHDVDSRSYSKMQNCQSDWLSW